MQASTAADRPDRALITGLARTFPGTPESVADVRSFVAEAYGLSEVLLPVELYGATEGLEVSLKGSIILRAGLL